METDWLDNARKIAPGRRAGARDLYERPWRQVDIHMTSNHGKSLAAPMSVDESEHTTIRVTIVFPINQLRPMPQRVGRVGRFRCATLCWLP